MVGRVEQAEVTPAVAVGPQHGVLAAVVGEQALRPEMADETGVLLRPPAVLALVTTRQQPPAADGEPGRHDPVDTEFFPGGADIALR